MQIFVNPPQRWNPIPIPGDEIDKFIELNKIAKIDPIIIHGIYLVNLASDNPFFYEAVYLNRLSMICKRRPKSELLELISMLVSTKGRELVSVMKKVDEAVKKILDGSPKGPFLILENSAGAGNIIGDTLDELSQIIKAVKSPRLKVLIDTAHAFESGYDLKTKAGLDEFLRQFDQLIGLNRLVGFHFNDSKTAYNSKRDRHADIGFGDLGKDIFPAILNHPKLKDLFGILETPQDNQSWKKQIELLKKMRTQ